MVLVPEVVDAVAASGRPVPVVAAGGIVTGRQMAAALALGADGVWTGSVWTDAWESEAAPCALPMPLQSMLTEAALRRVDQAAAGGNTGAKELATYWAGQGVGLMNGARPARRVVADMIEELVVTIDRLGQLSD